MTFSTAPFTTVLSWCEKNKCSRIEITNFDNGIVETFFLWNNHEITIKINTGSLVSSILIKKDLGQDLKNTIFSEDNIMLKDCLEILESKLSS